MAILSTLPTSRRGYLSQSELAQFANITINDTDEADDVISQAEELIDAYVGAQHKAFHSDLVGPVEAAGSTSFTLYSEQQDVYEQNYFKWCQVEIVGGTGEGQRRRITASTKAGVLTIDTAWDTTPDSTSFYKITQLGKFPRIIDQEYFSATGTPRYFKTIPENVRRAVAAQVEYYIEMGASFFSSDKSYKVSESIGDYSYSNANSGGTGLDKLVAPKAQELLRGIRTRIGQIV